jgi:capsular polysaccharide biosynthesis protein
MIKRLIYILATLALFCGAALFYLDSQIPRATATLKVNPAALPSSTGKLYSGYRENSFKLILSPETMNFAADSLAIPSQDRAEAIIQMTKNVTAKPIRGTDFIEITAKNPNSKKAAKIANAIAHAATKHRNEVQVILFKGTESLQRLSQHPQL